MKMTDGKRTIEITIQKWNETGYTGYGEDWSKDFFDAGSLPYDEETDTYTVEDVDYCIDYANSDNPEEGARFVIDENGDSVIDPDIVVSVTELD